MVMLALSAAPQQTRPLPADACAAAWQDVQTLSVTDRQFTRYVWNNEGTKDSAAAINAIVNSTLSRSGLEIIPAYLADGMLLRYDLRLLAPYEIEFLNLFKTWELLANTDSTFHSIATFNEACTPYKASDGRTYSHRSVRRITVAPHLGDPGTLLSAACNSNQPIVRGDWFARMAFTTLDGGLYYKFRGIQNKRQGNKSPLAVYLESRGTSEQQVQTLRSDSRSGTLRSKVTGQPRRTDLFRSLGVSPTAGTALVGITHDPGDFAPLAIQDPIRNLLTFSAKAAEVLVEMPNGCIEYSLWDAAGNLQDSVPDDVAVDHLIPAPHTKRLQPGLSCFRCHAAGDGWQSVPNDVAALLGSGMQILGDLSSRKSDDVMEIARKYSGNFEDPLRVARDNYANRIFRTTGGMSVQQAGAAVSNQYASYQLDLVTPQKACAELGYIVAEQDAVSTLRQLIPKLGEDTTPVDPIIFALLSGLSITRQQFEIIAPDLYWQSQQSALARKQ